MHTIHDLNTRREAHSRVARHLVAAIGSRRWSDVESPSATIT